MSAVAHKRFVMTLYSGVRDIHSHRARIVLAEKNVTFEFREVNPASPPEELLELNPYNTLPTLVDRDLVLYDSDIIMEYLDERFPHPPLMPVYPVARARSRLVAHRVREDWYSLFHKLEQLEAAGQKDTPQAQELKNKLLDSIVSVAPLFRDMPYFMSEEFSLVDCSIAPLLWRLPIYGIHLPANVKEILDYQERLFARESFQESLTRAERAMGEVA